MSDGRYKCVNQACDATFDDVEKARAHDELQNHWITDTEADDE